MKRILFIISILLPTISYTSQKPKDETGIGCHHGKIGLMNIGQKTIEPFKEDIGSTLKNSNDLLKESAKTTSEVGKLVSTINNNAIGAAALVTPAAPIVIGAFTVNMMANAANSTMDVTSRVTNYIFPPAIKRDQINNAKNRLKVQSFSDCLLKNRGCPVNTNGVPKPCEEEACQSAMAMNYKNNDQRLEAFSKYCTSKGSPQENKSKTTQSLQERFDKESNF